MQLFEKQANQNESSESNKNQAPKSSDDENKPKNELPKDENKKNEGDKQEKKKNSIDEEDRKNNTNKAIAYLTKAILWLCLIYSIGFTIYVVTSILSGKGVSGPDSESYTVSWKEFVLYMLTTGEVKELTIRPQFENVRITLHDGAILNGRRAKFSSYLLNVANTREFEERVRDVEKAIGITEGNNRQFSAFNV